MRTKKKSSIRNVSNLLSDKELKAAIGGSGDPGTCQIDYYVPYSCLLASSLCFIYDEWNHKIIDGQCKTINTGFEPTCECRPISV